MNLPSLSDVETIARQAGSILRAGINQEHEVSYKGVIDPVTEVDRASEKLIVDEINKRWPGSSILAEESGLTAGDHDQSWYVDPLDGTVNYAHRIPIFAVSIAFAYQGSMRLGVVYDPMRDELFSAERGRGALLNGNRIHVSQTEELQKSLLVTGFPYDAWNTAQDNFGNFARLGKLTQGVRRLGSAALDACYVAAGRYDGFWEMSLKPWDVAAGGLIASEAGAVVSDVRNRPDYLSAPQSVVAATPAIHAQLLAHLMLT